mmetsp:Transcript_48625/g.113893  ORF Transcript_48625/g.113893 Transcript_48625/m.113893 type:complete len:529 (-) Transcript_48625:44-1630(-)
MVQLARRLGLLAYILSTTLSSATARGSPGGRHSHLVRAEDDSPQALAEESSAIHLEGASVPSAQLKALKDEEAHLASFLRNLHDGFAEVDKRVGHPATLVGSVAKAVEPDASRSAQWDYGDQDLQRAKEAFLKEVQPVHAAHPENFIKGVALPAARDADPASDFLDAAEEAAIRQSMQVHADGTIADESVTGDKVNEEEDANQHLNGPPCAVPDVTDHGLSIEDVESKNKLHESFPDFCVPTAQIGSGMRCMPGCDEAAGFLPSTSAALACNNGKLNPEAFTCERGCKTTSEVGGKVVHACKSDSKLLSPGDTCLAPTEECTEGEAKTMACQPDGTLTETNGCAPAACKVPEQAGIKACKIPEGGPSLSHGGICVLECLEMWTPKATGLKCDHGVVHMAQAADIRNATAALMEVSIEDSHVAERFEEIEGILADGEELDEEIDWQLVQEDAHRRRFCLRPCQTPQGEGGPHCLTNPLRIPHNGECQLRCKEGWTPSHTTLRCKDGMLKPAAETAEGTTNGIPHCKAGR